jgi:hypothetical protein
LKKGVQTAICCPCGNEKILALGLCATCYTLKRQDAEYFGGLREQVLERDGYACRVCGDPDPGVSPSRAGQVCAASDDRPLCGGVSREGPPKVVLTEFPPLLLVLWRDRRTLISTFANNRQYLPARGVVPIQFNRRDLRSRQFPRSWKAADG